MTKKLFKTLKDALYVFISFTLVMFLCQCALIYPGAEDNRPNDHQGLEVIKVTTSDNLEVEMLKSSPQKNNKKAILMFHGNADLASSQIHTLKGLDNSFDLFALEYRGYGTNPGTPSEKNLGLDAKAALQYIQNQNYKTIVYYAHSIGTGVAVNLSKEHIPNALILEAPFTSLADLGKETLPVFPKWFIKLVLIDEYNSAETLSVIEIPKVMVMHGNKDRIISFKQGQQVFEAVNSPDKTFKAYPLGDHNDLYFMNREDLKAFLKAIN